MKTTKREIENIFRIEIEKKISNNGYQLDENNIFRKRHNKDIMWFFSASLWNDRPYSVSSSIGCEYINATVAIKKFIEENGGVFEEFAKVTFAGELDRHAQTNHIIKISSESDIQLSVDIFLRKLDEAEKKFLLPRVDQKIVVEEYFKPIAKWPTGDLTKCCVTILSYALINNDFSLFKRGLERVFETINKPNYSQRNREFFEFLKNSSPYRASN